MKRKENQNWIIKIIKKRNYNERKKYFDYELYKVPFEKNIIDYILKIHKENNHRSAAALRIELNKRKISYYGIINLAIENVQYVSQLKKTK